MNNVTILGIHDGHNAGTALVKNGKVLAAMSEERLNNIKNYSGSLLESVKAGKGEIIDRITVKRFKNLSNR